MQIVGQTSVQYSTTPARIELYPVVCEGHTSWKFKFDRNDRPGPRQDARGAHGYGVVGERVGRRVAAVLG